MSKLRLKISMSLDGFVAGPNESEQDPIGVGGMQLHEWMFPLAAFRQMQTTWATPESSSNSFVRSRRRASCTSNSVPEDRAVVPKPANLTFEQAAAVPVAAISALQGLRDKGQLQPGQKVLINGASGGVGTFAVQIAKAFGAEVSGVCSTRNVELVRSLGADRVIDYTQEDFTRSEQRYDVMLDIAGNRSWSDYKRVLNDKATLVVVGGPKTNRWIGPFAHLVRVRLASLAGSRKVAPFLAKVTKQDLVVLQELLETGKVTPVIDRQYDLSEVPEALRYLGEGHARGKVVVTA